MNSSNEIKTIAPAYLKAQKKIGAAVKGSVNPFFKSKYADLGSVMEACKDILNENGISVLQPVVNDTVETILMHESGEWFSSSTKIISKADNDPQAQGSAITYARRYGLQSMVFIPAEDDDGERATDHNEDALGIDLSIDGPKGQGGICPVHKTKLEWKAGTNKTTGKPYGFWACTSKNADGSYCRAATQRAWKYLPYHPS